MAAVLRVRDNEGNYYDIPSIKGDKGKSAYEYAVDGGYQGTEEEFASLLGNVGGSGTTKRPTAEITLEMWNEQYVDSTKQTILLGADEIDIDPALAGKEIADVEFLTGNEIVSIKDIAEKDSIGYISMYNHFVASEVDGVPITFFAGIFYPSNKGWLYIKLTSYAINAIKITYYTD